jgi:predicted metal-dependent peptidase
MQPSSPDELKARVTRARIRLALRQPFLASALMRLPIVQVDAMSWCTTMATDGFHIFYNPGWVAKLQDSELRGVLAHELLHVLFSHATRRAARVPKVWNQACDYAINLLLIDVGFRLPKGGLADDRFSGMTSEQIYDDLLKSSSQRHGGGSSRAEGDLDEHDESGVLCPVGADLLDPDDPRTMPLRSSDMPDAEQLRDLAAELRTEASSRLQGRVGAWFQQECDAADSARVDWRAVLRAWLQDRMRCDWSMWPPSKKHIHRGLLLPSVGVEAPGHLVFAVDTSGSMELSVLAQIYGEIAAFRETFPCSLSVIQADTAVKSVVEYGELDGVDIPKHFAVVGRGGTDFRAVFKWMEERLGSSTSASSALVFATDGAGRFPDAPPGWPVIWLRTPNGVPDRAFPFGMVVDL